MEPAQARRPGPEIQRKRKATEDDLGVGQQLVARLARTDWSYTLAEVALYRPWRPGLAEFDVKPAPSIVHMQASVDRRYTIQSVVGDRHDHQDFSGQHHALSASARGGPVDTCAFPDCQRSPSGCVRTNVAAFPGRPRGGAHLDPGGFFLQQPKGDAAI